MRGSADSTRPAAAARRYKTLHAWCYIVSNRWLWRPSAFWVDTDVPRTRLSGLAETLASLVSLVTHRNSSLSLSILPGSVDVNLLTQPKNKF